MSECEDIDVEWVDDLPRPARPFARFGRFLWRIGKRHVERRKARIAKNKAVGQAAGRAASASSDATEAQ